jgi:4'-phosphopantetheinyl transferase
MIQILYTLFPEKFDKPVFDYYLGQLPAAMQQSVLKYRRWQDAHASLMGKILLIEGLKEFGYDKHLLHRMEYSYWKRPYLPVGIDFNISHSGNCAICVVGSNVDLGIDVEEIRPIEIDDFYRQFTDDEMNDIYSAPDKVARFYSWWTKKEAVIKADGMGMSIPLRNIRFTRPTLACVHNKRWHLTPLNIHENYSIHLATSRSVEDNPPNIKLIARSNLETRQHSHNA